MNLFFLAAITGSVNSSISEYTLDETRGGKIRRNKIVLSPMESNTTSVSSVEQKRMKKSRVSFK